MKTPSIDFRKNAIRSRSVLCLMIALSFTVTSFKVNAQTPYKNAEGSQVKVFGSSNLHDWTMIAKTFSCEGAFIVKGGQLVDVTALTLSIPVKNVKSNESLMDKRAYKTLNADQFSNIVFKLTNATVNAQQKIIKATGNLTISGVSNLITLQISYAINGDEILCKGSQSLKMTEYKIKPPSFMLGALKTGDDLKIDISLKMTK